MKIHEIAKQLNVNSKEVLERTQKMGIDVKSHLNSVSEEVAQKIIDSFKTKEADNKNKIANKEKKNKKDTRSCNNKKRSDFYRR